MTNDNNDEDDDDDNYTNNKDDEDDDYEWWWWGWLWLMMTVGMTASNDEDEDKAGTELLSLSILHAIYIEMTPQLKWQLIAETSAFEGLSYCSQPKRLEQ